MLRTKQEDIFATTATYKLGCLVFELTSPTELYNCPGGGLQAGPGLRGNFIQTTLFEVFPNKLTTETQVYVTPESSAMGAGRKGGGLDSPALGLVYAGNCAAISRFFRALQDPAPTTATDVHRGHSTQ